jgi:hypothetical protein
VGSTAAVCGYFAYASAIVPTAKPRGSRIRAPAARAATMPPPLDFAVDLLERCRYGNVRSVLRGNPRGAPEGRALRGLLYRLPGKAKSGAAYRRGERSMSRSVVHGTFLRRWPSQPRGRANEFIKVSEEGAAEEEPSFSPSLEPTRRGRNGRPHKATLSRTKKPEKTK